MLLSDLHFYVYETTHAILEHDNTHYDVTKHVINLIRIVASDNYSKFIQHISKCKRILC